MSNNKCKTKTMQTYPAWRDAHPIRAWAREHDVALSAIAAQLRVSPQSLNEWMRSEPPDDERFGRLCKLMSTKPEVLRAQITAWRDKGQQIAV